MNFNGLKISDLKRLPVRKWDDTSAYDSILICKEGGRHESGWGLMMIVGCIGGKPQEVCSLCSDDIIWVCNTARIRTDMLYPSGVIHFWGNGLKFIVGSALSSIEVKVINQ